MQPDASRDTAACERLRARRFLFLEESYRTRPQRMEPQSRPAPRVPYAIREHRDVGRDRLEREAAARTKLQARPKLVAPSRIRSLRKPHAGIVPSIVLKSKHLTTLAKTARPPLCNPARSSMLRFAPQKNVNTPLYFSSLFPILVPGSTRSGRISGLSHVASPARRAHASPVSKHSTTNAYSALKPC